MPKFLLKELRLQKKTLECEGNQCYIALESLYMSPDSRSCLSANAYKIVSPDFVSHASIIHTEHSYELMST
jgi:hypothetical protein